MSNPKSSDFTAIQMAAEFIRLSEQLAAHLNMASTDIMMEFDRIAWLLNGGQSCKFAVLRSLVRRFGSRNARWLNGLIAEKSNSQWHVKIEQRKDHARTDGGAWRQKYEKELEVDRIGTTYYRFRGEGLNDRQSVTATLAKLHLNLSPRTIKGKLLEFRKAVIARGYVDPNAPQLTAWRGGPVSEPQLTVADISKKGRPRKRVQTPTCRSVLLPPMKHQ